jgi:hypothetical protein
VLKITKQAESLSTRCCRVWAPKARQKQQETVNKRRFIEYLQQELGISETEIALANRERQPSVTELPIVLWNYGLIDLEKLGKIFDWMESAA